ncbi:MAG TPA: phospholipase C, phosphocholine-specific [Rhodanobacteraceae bacterium]
MTFSSDRRRFLRTALQSAGAAATLSLLPPGMRKALALPAHQRTGTLEDIEHIVVLTQENRAFDHYFGSLRGVRGFADPHPIRLPGGKPVWHQPDGKGGSIAPFHPQASDLGMRFLEDLAHDWPSTHQAWHGGRHDQWVPAKGATTMAYLTREDIPYHYQLADAFTICDAYHCSVLGPTDPNRYYLWTGWVGNDGKGGGPVIDDAEAGYAWATFPETLERAGISWKVYQDIGPGLDGKHHWGWVNAPYVGNYGDNALLYFDQYRHAKPGNPLYDKARRGSNFLGGEDYLADLRHDVEANQLPSVSWIVSPEAFCEHPNWPANYGAWYIDQVLQALTANPAVWSRTALLLNYDENDGFFDHMAPPFAAWSEATGKSTVTTHGEYFAGDSHYHAGPYGLGVRVPMLVISPWSRGGWVCSEVFDHTSVIRLIEKRFGHDGNLAEPHISPWRRAVCGDLTSAFDFAHPNDHLPQLPTAGQYAPIDRKRHDDYKPEPPATQTLPRQEPGIRPARALPYALEVTPVTSSNEGELGLRFSNHGKAAAVLLLYSQGQDLAVRSYTVEAGKGLTDTLPLGADDRHDWAIHGPNGFLRRFAGRHGDRLLAQMLADAGKLHITLANQSGATRTLTLHDAYAPSRLVSRTLAPGAQTRIDIDASASFNWYDLAVRCTERPGFAVQWAGHLETGHDSVSDPALGATA